MENIDQHRRTHDVNNLSFSHVRSKLIHRFLVKEIALIDFQGVNTGKIVHYGGAAGYIQCPGQEER